MKMSEMFPSSWLKKEDVPQPIRATIREVTQEEISGDGGKELKAVVAFMGNVKPMILNRGNAAALEEAFGDDSDLWHGKQVEIYVDGSVMFAGRRVGGLRLRVPDARNGAPNAPHSDLWDISDGTKVTQRQTTDQVRAFLNTFQGRIDSVKVKVTGADRSTAVTADRWIEGATVVNPDADLPF